MKRIGLYMSILFLCCSTLNSAFAAKKEQPLLSGVQYQGIIEAVDLEEGKIDINSKSFAFAMPVKIMTADKTIISVSVLSSGQLVEFWLDDKVTKQNPELPYATVKQLRILSDINPKSITH